MKTGVRSPTLHMTVLFTVAVFVSTLAMSILFRVEVVSQGKGRVVPVSRVKAVQTEFAGRIVAIRVRNGSHVQKGELLIRLDPTDAETQIGTIAAETDSLLIERERIAVMTVALQNPAPEAPGFVAHALSGFRVTPLLAKAPTMRSSATCCTPICRISSRLKDGSTERCCM
jgi:hemolysin D